jgi:molybdopterin-containing oxidoreductase family iron-sulfur binding subunit
VVRPRFDVVSLIDVLAALAGDPRDAQALVRETSGLDASAWRKALATGVIANSTSPARTVSLAAPDSLIAELARALAADAPPYELAVAASPLHDGRFASNAWLQELPHPITKQMWGNAALMSPATAAELGVTTGDRVQLAGRAVLPALIVPGHAERAITVELGYGRSTPGLPIADQIGYAPPPTAITPRRAPGRDEVILAQLTLDQHDRPIAPSATLAQLRATPDLAADLRGAQPTLLPAQEHAGLQWAMSIDTSLCTGCNACVVACQAENNTPTVGPEHAARGRRMHWLRIDSYVADDGYVHQPVPCMHCEHAPCEYVCPVGATTHSPDGLNEQVYNRCVGTRFCSNNCPYKVRRFNWFSFERPTTTRALQYNPDVTVRSRGVMEKCTYCVQRIRGAEHAAIVEHREIRPGEVVTACQAACPTTAIAFGALSHPGPLAQRRTDPRRYELLHHLGTRPRTQHLLRVRNPHEDA